MNSFNISATTVLWDKKVLKVEWNWNWYVLWYIQLLLKLNVLFKYYNLSFNGMIKLNCKTYLCLKKLNNILSFNNCMSVFMCLFYCVVRILWINIVVCSSISLLSINLRSIDTLFQFNSLLKYIRNFNFGSLSICFRHFIFVKKIKVK